MEPEELERAVEAVLFAAGEPVELKRLSQALGCETGEVQEAANRLMDRLGFERRGFGWCGWMAPTRCALPVRWGFCLPGPGDPEAAEALGVSAGDPVGHRLLSACHQSHGGADPGVDSSYSVTALLNKKAD